MKFIANTRMKGAPTPEVMALFPAEAARVAELQAQGILESLYVAADFSRAWLVLKGESQEMVQQAVESLPLYKFNNVELIPLAEFA
ncbi:MAG: muconolactone Delta-isomerase family protein [Anaerolineae bacterium]